MSNDLLNSVIELDEKAALGYIRAANAADTDPLSIYGQDLWDYPPLRS